MKVTEVEFVKSAARASQAPPERLPEVAFLGPSNVGKSSLINSLLGRKGVAKVSKTPGRTQLLNFFRVNRKMHFVDLPGYGFAKVPKAVQDRFLRSVEGYLSSSERLALLVLLLDCRRRPGPRDIALRTWLEDNDVPHVLVLTKADKLNQSQLNRSARDFEQILGLDEIGASVLTFSAKTGRGRQELWSVISEAIRTPPGEGG